MSMGAHFGLRLSEPGGRRCPHSPASAWANSPSASAAVERRSRKRKVYRESRRWRVRKGPSPFSPILSIAPICSRPGPPPSSSTQAAAACPVEALARQESLRDVCAHRRVAISATGRGPEASPGGIDGGAVDRQRPSAARGHRRAVKIGARRVSARAASHERRRASPRTRARRAGDAVPRRARRSRCAASRRRDRRRRLRLRARRAVAQGAAGRPVCIGEDVEIGANTTIDRGAIEDTVIEDGVKLDNQIQIGHNVRIGAHTAIAGCVGISGSTTIGRRCMIGGRCGIVGHLTICDDVVITGSRWLAIRSSASPAYTPAAFRPRDARIWRACRALQADRRVRARSPPARGASTEPDAQRDRDEETRLQRARALT